MNNTMSVTPTNFYDKIYQSKRPCEHEWVAGTASPELIKLVWEQVIKPGSKVLEVGTGVGTESVFLAVRGMQVTGLDISQEAVKIGKRLAEFYGVSVNFNQGNALEMPFEDDSFDVVCDQGVFHHLADEDRDTYARHVSRVLKRGGLFVLRSFSDKIPGGPQPRRIKSQEITDTFLPYFNLEHLERVLSFSTETRQLPLGWYGLLINK